MIKRYLHRHVNNQCNTPNCNATAKDHNKLYWHDPKEVNFPTLHSATFCRNCYYKLTTGLPEWIELWDTHYVSSLKHFKTLKECNADLIARLLS